MARSELNDPTLAGLAGETPGGGELTDAGRAAAGRYWPASLALLALTPRIRRIVSSVRMCACRSMVAA